MKRKLIFIAVFAAIYFAASVVLILINRVFEGLMSNWTFMLIFSWIWFLFLYSFYVTVVKIGTVDVDNSWKSNGIKGRMQRLGILPFFVTAVGFAGCYWISFQYSNLPSNKIIILPLFYSFMLFFLLSIFRLQN